MESNTPLEGETTLKEVKTEQSTEQPVEHSEVEKTEAKTESRETSEPPTKKSKIEASGHAKTPEITTKNEPPVHEMVGGSSVRQYLNKHLTEHILEGLKQVSRDKPEDPLRELGEFLILRSKQLQEK